MTREIHRRSRAARRDSGSGWLISVLALGVFACGGDAGNDRNVLFLVVDTLRADHLGVYGYERPVSPEIDAWATRGAIFDRATATSPWTLPSFGSLFTGQLPSRHAAGLVAPGPQGERAFVQLDGSVPTLAEILGEHGYETVAILNNPFLHPSFQLGRGFETYDYVPGDNATIRRANVIVDRTLRFFDQRDGRPFFLVAHFFDPHMNYDPPIAVSGRFKDGYAGSIRLPITDLKGIRTGTLALDAADREFVVAAYDEEVFFVDVQIGRLLEGMRTRGLLDDTVIVLVSDHGEELWDHGGFEHGHTLYQELLHVPLVIWGPQVQSRRIASPVSIEDVFPTVLEALELPVPEGISGRSLWPALTSTEAVASRPLVAEANLYGPERKTLIRWPHKVVLNVVTRQRRLYDLASDPDEKIDLAPKNAALLNELLTELQGVLRTANRERIRQQAATLDPATKEQLRALGYLD